MLAWIGEERLPRGGAASDCQLSKAQANKTRIGPSRKRGHVRVRPCSYLSLSRAFVAASPLCSSRSASVSIGAALMADCGGIELYLYSFIPISQRLPPGRLLPSSGATCRRWLLAPKCLGMLCNVISASRNGSIPSLLSSKLKWAESKTVSLFLKLLLRPAPLICEELFGIRETETVTQINVLVTHKGCAEGGGGGGARRVWRRRAVM